MMKDFDVTKRRIQDKLRKKAQVKRVAPDPPPPYDEVFVKGMQWLEDSNMRLLGVTEQGLVFRTQLKNGVPTVGDEVDLATKIAKEYNRDVEYVQGDFDKTEFILDRPLSEQEAEEIESKYLTD